MRTLHVVLLAISLISFELGWLVSKLMSKEETYSRNSSFLSISESNSEKKQATSLFIKNQRFDAYGNFRKETWLENRFNCSISKNKTIVNSIALVLNSYRNIDLQNYIYNNKTYKNIYFLNTTYLPQTSNWERNCQQAHTQAIDSFFFHFEEDYVIILEDDLLQVKNINKSFYIETINCAIENKIDFLYFENHNVSSFWFGTRAYLLSKTFYFDVFRNICFAKNSYIPIDMCWLRYFNLIVVDQPLIYHIYSDKGTTREIFKLTDKLDDNTNPFDDISFDDSFFNFDTNSPYLNYIEQ